MPAERTEAPAATRETPSRISSPKRNIVSRDELPPLPADLLDENSQQSHLRALLGVSNRPNRAAAIDSWALAMKNPAELLAALNALTTTDAAERGEMMKAFGPALLSRWGELDPKNGLLKWAELGLEDQWLLAGVEPDELTRGGSTAAPLPRALLEAWSSTSPDTYFSELIKSDSLFRKEELRQGGAHDSYANLFSVLVSQQPIEALTRQLNAFENEKNRTPDARIELMTPFVSTKLIMEKGGIEEALQTVNSLPESPARELLSLDLNASRFLWQTSDLGYEVDQAGRVDKAVYDEVRDSFLNASVTGQSQFFVSLTNSEEWGGLQELNPEYVALRSELEAAFLKNPNLDKNQRYLVPSGSEREGERGLSAAQLEMYKKNPGR
jgi:hypothetical protein